MPQKKVHGFFSESETGTKFKKMEEEGVKNAPWLPFLAIPIFQTELFKISFTFV